MMQLSLFTDIRFICEQITDSRYSLWICVSQTRYEDVLVFFYIVLVIIFNIHITIKICCLKFFHSKIVLQQSYCNLCDIYIVTQVLKHDYVRTKLSKMLTLEPPSCRRLTIMTLPSHDIKAVKCLQLVNSVDFVRTVLAIKWEVEISLENSLRLISYSKRNEMDYCIYHNL